MTVTAKASRKVISGSGWVNPLQHDIMIENASHIEVWADGDQLALGVDFLVNDVLVEAGYTVTIVNPADWEPVVWVLEHKPPIEQNADLSLGGQFGSAHEYAMDAIIRRLQSLEDRVDRAVVVSRDNTVGAAQMVLPVPGEDELLGWNADGTALVTKPEASIPVNAAIAAAAAALAAMPNAFPATRTVLAALPDTNVNAYLTEAGFEGQYAQVDATDPDIVALLAADVAGGEVKVKSGNPNLAYLRQRKNGDLFKSSEHGGGQLGMVRAIAAASQRMISLGPVAGRADVEINETGTVAWLVGDTGLVVPHNVSLVGLGKGKTIFNGAALVTPNLVEHASGLVSAAGRRFIDVRPLTGTFNDLYIELPEFSNISARLSYVDFIAAHGLSIGDVFIVYKSADFSWMATRAEYRMGDRFEVTGVDGNRVYVDHDFRDDYVYSATVRAHRQITRGGRFGGFTIDTAGSGVATLEGLAFNSCKNLRVDDIAVWDAGENGFQFNQCFDAIATDCDATTQLSNGVTSVYPFSFRNSTRCRVRGGTYMGDWHSIDFGGYNSMGGVLNYDCVAEDINGYGSGQSTTAAHSFNMHGNADMCGFRRCFGTGYGFGGRDTFFDDGNLVIPGDATGVIKLVHAGEVRGGKHRIARTRMYSNRNGGTGSTAGAIYLDIDEALEETFVQLLDVDIDMPVETQPIRLVSSGTNPFPISLDFRGKANVPAATVLGLVRLIGPTVASTSAHIRIDVTDLPDGVPYATSSGTFTAREWDFGVQQGIANETPTASATFNGTTVTFNHAYPAAYTDRKVWLQVQGPAAGLKVSARPAALPTATSFVPQLFTGDGTNLTAAATRIAWWAT